MQPIEMRECWISCEVMNLSENIFEIRNLSKHFAGVKALDWIKGGMQGAKCD
jgi:hypothetical protein